MFCQRSLSSLLSEVKNIFSGHVQLPGITATFPFRSKWSEVNATRKIPGKGYYRRTVHYPEKYTLKPIPTTNMAGRDPESGRVVVATLGGGLKHPFLWVDYLRSNPPDQPSLVERVLEIIPEPNRTAHVALVGHGDKLRYIIATENMKPGDIIETSGQLTRIPVRANEGDAYPVGSLAPGTIVCCVELLPGKGAMYARAAGTKCTILRKIEDRVIIMLPDKKQEVSLDQHCMAVVGAVSNAIHNTIPIGSANRLRWLGYRPRSGLWQRKSGRHGRKIRPPPPVREILVERPEPIKIVKLSLDSFPYHPSATIFKTHKVKKQEH